MRMHYFFTLFFLLSPILAIANESIKLSPEIVRERLLEEGLAVKLLALEHQSAIQNISQVKSRFDTNLELNATHQIDKSARTNTFFGTRTDTTDWNLGLNRLFPTGSHLNLQFLNQRTKIFNPSTVIGIPTSGIYEPKLLFSLNQSLGKNLIGRLDRQAVKQAQKQVEGIDLSTQHQVSQILAEGERLFWNWLIAGELQNLSKELLNKSHHFLRLTQKKANAGIIEETDLLSVKALVAFRQSQTKEAEIIFSTWEAKLREILLLPEDITITHAIPEDFHVIPAEAGIQQRKRLDLHDDAGASATLQNRADFLAQKKVVEEKGLELSIDKNSLWPSIDLKASLQLNQVNAGNYATALEDIDSPSYQVGLQISMPLENRAARSKKIQSRHQKAKALVKLKLIEEKIKYDLSQTNKRLQLKNESFTHLYKNQKIQKEKLNKGLDSYKKGRFSAEKIIGYQDDYFLAKQRWLQAKLNYQEASIDWQLARRTILP